MRQWVPLVLGAVLVPAAVTAAGFSVAGEELTTALSPSPATPPPPPAGPVPLPAFLPPLRMERPAPLLVPAAVAQQNVRWASPAVPRTVSGGAVTLVGQAGA
ncbi:hypothetical protein ACVDFE_12630 [Lentzea chajnantorensis]